MANFGLDYDGTFTEDPFLFHNFIKTARAQGHKVYIVTMRYPSEFTKESEILDKIVDGIVCTGRRGKKETTKKLGINIHIWIDDEPRAINEDANSVYGWASEEGAIISNSHGSLTRIRDGETLKDSML